MEVERALADLAEVRGRLATSQRFYGYSGGAAIVSGLVAVGAGAVQFALAPHPRTTLEMRTYLTIWFACLAFALAVNYGAIMAWWAHNRNAQTRVQLKSVGASILPAIAAGGVLTAAFLTRGLDALLPGMWCTVYALGLFASRATVPIGVVHTAVAFGAVASLLLLWPGLDPLAWWVMPSSFGLGQVAIGAIVGADDAREVRG